MDDGSIVINENEINDIKAYLDRSSDNIENTSQKISSLFSSFTDVGLFSDGAMKIKSQMDSISSQVSDMGTSIHKQYDDMEKIENKLSRMADEIEIPNDFITNDSSININVNSGKLKKNDGKKVKSDKKDDKKKLQFESSIKYNDNLKEIVKQYEEEHGEILLNGNLVHLSSIKNDNKVTIDETTDNSIIIKKIVTKLNNEMSKKIPDVDMSSNIEKIDLVLKKIGPLKNVEFDDLYKIVKSELSSILVNGNYNLVR